MKYPFPETRRTSMATTLGSRSRIYRSTEDPALSPNSTLLDMFPYPSGTGLHISATRRDTLRYGHCKSLQANVQDFNVLHPMGFDAFGLPTERQAMKEQIHPRKRSRKGIWQRLLDVSLRCSGFDYDWSREVNDHRPATTSSGRSGSSLKIYNSWYDSEEQDARVRSANSMSFRIHV